MKLTKSVKPPFSCQTPPNLPTPQVQSNPSHSSVLWPLQFIPHLSSFLGSEQSHCLFDTCSVTLMSWTHSRFLYHGYEGVKTLLKCQCPPWRDLWWPPSSWYGLGCDTDGSPRFIFLFGHRWDPKVCFFIWSAKWIKLLNSSTSNYRPEETELKVPRLVGTQELLRLSSKVNYTRDI